MLEILSYLLIGAFSGFMAGLLGIGGGLLVVPGLLFVFKMQQMPSNLVMHMAAGSSLAAMIVASLSSTWAHYRRHIAMGPIYRQLIVGLILGTVVGVVLGAFIKSRILEFLFGLLVITVAIMLLLNFKPSPQRQLPQTRGMRILGAVIGINSGLFGLGGGSISIPYFSYCNVPLRQAIGVSTLISFTVAVIGTISFMITGLHASDLPSWSTGYIYWPAVLVIAIASPTFAALGAALSHRISVLLLQRIFAVFLLIVGVRMLV